MQNKFDILKSSIIPIVLIVIWHLVSESLNKFYIPTPTSVFWEFKNQILSIEFWTDTFGSFERLFYSLSICIPFGIAFGLLMGYYRTLFLLFNPIIQFIRVLPITALLPIIIIAFGFSIWSSIIVICLASIVPILISSIFAAEEIKSKYHQFIKNLKIDTLTSFKKIIFPASVIIIFPSIDICINTAFRMMIVAELFGSNSGLGFRLLESAQFLNFPKVYALLFAVGFFGLAIHFILKYIKNTFVRISL